MDVSVGVVKGDQGFKSQSWDILGQTYVPLHVSETSFSWHATLPEGSFVPYHVHGTQDEYIYVLEGRLEFVLDGKDLQAEAGDLVSLPKKVPHSIHNRSGKAVKAVFVVSPTRKLYEYFQKLDRLTDKDEIARLAEANEVPFV